MLRLISLSFVVAVFACQSPATSKENPASPQAKAAPSVAAAAVPTTAGFESPRAVYTRYAETLNASRWTDAIALFTQSGKTKLILANFKGLAMLAGSQHPKQQEYKAVLHELCQAHALRCVDERWTATFTSTLFEEGNVTGMLSDVTSLAKEKPEATYIEVMKLLQGVDANAIVALDPGLSEVRYIGNTATGVARRTDGQTSVMSFENTPDHGWLISE